MAFVEVANVDEVPEGGAKNVNVGGRDVALFNCGGKIYAISRKCTHMGGSLDEGILDGFLVTCPLHLAQFDVRTGKVVRGPATKDAKVHKVKIEGKSVKVEV